MTGTRAPGPHRSHGTTTPTGAGTGCGPTVWIAVHDLSRTGVPVVLSRLLRTVPRGQRHGVHVIAMHGGPMARDVGSVAGSLTVLEPDDRRSAHRAVAVGLRSIPTPRRIAGRVAGAVEGTTWRRALAHLPDPDVLLVHGSGAWPLTVTVGDDTRIVLHVHELETAFDRSIPTVDQGRALRRSARVMVVSDAVADLVAGRGAPTGRIVVVPGVIDAGDVAGRAASTGPGVLRGAGTAGRSAPDRGRDWVVGVGSPGWRKGTDRLAPIAFELRRRLPASGVAWVGGVPGGQYGQWVDADDPVVWFDQRDDPWEVAADASVILVPSREDPLPLVALEAGQRGLAVVSTPTGGLPGLLADGRGAVSRRHHVGELVDLVEEVLRTPDMATDLGAALQRHVNDTFGADVVGPTWWQAVTSDT